MAKILSPLVDTIFVKPSTKKVKIVRNDKDMIQSNTKSNLVICQHNKSKVSKVAKIRNRYNQVGDHKVIRLQRSGIDTIKYHT